LFFPGSRVKLEHTLYLNEFDISDLIKKSPEEVRALYDQSFKKEENMYEILQSGMKVWENDAKETQRLQLALNYLEIAPIEHTGNRWVEDEKGVRTISNMVYKMTCSISENTKWNLWSSNALNKRWHVEWQILLNTPKSYHHIVIAGKERRYSERRDAESYLNGRIRAFAKYFQEISPPVPADHKYAFMESGLMLPGYHVEGEEPRQERDSVIGKLNEAKLQHESAPAAPSKKKKDPEI
jgi:hypothetical protein